jgi:hypothetical protein
MWWQHKQTGIRQFAAEGSDVERRLKKLLHLWEPAAPEPEAVPNAAPESETGEALLSNAVPAADLRKLSKRQLRQLATRWGIDDGFQTRDSLIESIEQHFKDQQAAEASGAPEGAATDSEAVTSGDAASSEGEGVEAGTGVSGAEGSEGAPATAEGNEGDGANGADGTNAE